MLWIIIVFLIVILDQSVKIFAMNVLKASEGIAVIKDIFYLYYVENRGAAFGILQNQKNIFIGVTIIIVSALIVYILYTKPSSKLAYLSVSLIIGGAVGNFIDRAFRGYVVDMFDFRIIHFAVFNVADSCVVVGTILFALYLLFLDKPKKVKGDEQY